MYPGIGRADFCGKLFEVNVDGMRMEVGSKRGGKDERSLAVLFVFPALPFPTRFEPILCLGLPPPPQKLQNKWGWSNNNNTGLIIFERGEGEASFSQGPLLQLFVDGKAALLKIHAVPGEADGLR